LNLDRRENLKFHICLQFSDIRNNILTHEMSIWTPGHSVGYACWYRFVERCLLKVVTLQLANSVKQSPLDFMADVLMGFHRSTFSNPNTEFNSHLASCDLWAFPTMKRELRGKKFPSDQRSAARFPEVDGAV
jgi:hypothetical protein